MRWCGACATAPDQSGSLTSVSCHPPPGFGRSGRRSLSVGTLAGMGWCIRGGLRRRDTPFDRSRPAIGSDASGHSAAPQPCPTRPAPPRSEGTSAGKGCHGLILDEIYSVNISRADLPHTSSGALSPEGRRRGRRGM
jgi:hypothetical protein